jgi:hypothetical protein
MTSVRAQFRRHLPIFAVTLIVFGTLAVFVIMWPR